MKVDKIIYLILFLTIGALALTPINGQVFFFNRTASMTKGIYVKNKTNNFEIGDIIIFKINSHKSNLIKYIAGIANDEYCSDEKGNLWINEIYLSKKSIENYQQETLAQSICQRLNEDELLVIGEHENSYDSRYFGPIKKRNVIATVKLFWAFD